MHTLSALTLAKKFLKRGVAAPLRFKRGNLPIMQIIWRAEFFAWVYTRKLTAALLAMHAKMHDSAEAMPQTLNAQIESPRQTVEALIGQSVLISAKRDIMTGIKRHRQANRRYPCPA